MPLTQSEFISMARGCIAMHQQIRPDKPIGLRGRILLAGEYTPAKMNNLVDHYPLGRPESQYLLHEYDLLIGTGPILSKRSGAEFSLDALEAIANPYGFLIYEKDKSLQIICAKFDLCSNKADYVRFNEAEAENLHCRIRIDEMELEEIARILIDAVYSSQTFCESFLGGGY